jgi:hypothetical protein
MIETVRRIWEGTRFGVLAVSLTLLIGGCAGGSSSFASADNLYDYYDGNGDNTLTRDEWDQDYRNMDSNGDGVVTRDEFNAAAGGFGGGFGGGGRR